MPGLKEKKTAHRCFKEKISNAFGEKVPATSLSPIGLFVISDIEEKKRGQAPKVSTERRPDSQGSIFLNLHAKHFFCLFLRFYAPSPSSPATGHGMKAGTMVTAVKSLFGTYDESVNIPEFFNNCTRIIKGMNLGHLYMAMMILQVKKNKIIASTAGMPPVLISRKESQTVDEIFIKGPPLGGFVNFSYQQREAKVGKGDILLLMSDGFPELFNQQDEMLGMARVKRIFKDTVKESPGDIIASLNEAAERWSSGRTQEDDITFLVIKWK